jgi:dTDP-glucose 4,6-dehydratase
MDENHPLNPKTPYAAAKAGADRLVYSYIESYDIPGIILRPFNNYGIRQHLEKLIPRFITSALLKEPLTVHGDGSALRDWIFVEDTVRAIDMAMHVPLEKVKGEVFNLGTGIAISVFEIAKKIIQLFDLDDSYITYMRERFGQVEKHISSTTKASEILGFKTAVIFDEGIIRTIDWFKANRTYWERQLFMKKVPVKDKDGKIILF